MRRARKLSPGGDRNSAWRPSFVEGPVRVVHLGTNFEPHGGVKSGRGLLGEEGMGKKRSSHSLKRITPGAPRRGPGSPLGRRDDESVENGGGTRRGESAEFDESKYGTMATYRTANEGEAGGIGTSNFTVGRAGSRRFQGGRGVGGDAKSKLEAIFSRDDEMVASAGASMMERDEEGEEGEEVSELEAQEYEEEVRLANSRHEEVSPLLATVAIK